MAKVRSLITNNMWYSQDVKRGDVFDVPDDGVALLEARGLIQTGKGELRQPYQESADLPQLLKAEAAKHHNSENDPRPGSEPLRTPRPAPREGWGV